MTAVMLGIPGVAPGTKARMAGKAGAPAEVGCSDVENDRVDPSLFSALYQRLVGGGSKKIPVLARSTVFWSMLHAKPSRGEKFLPGVRKLRVYTNGALASPLGAWNRSYRKP